MILRTEERMCELLGFNGNKKRQLNTELKEFYSHAWEHPNGWGLALFDGSNAEIFKESVNALKSNYLHQKLSETICARNAIAHIRLATIGNEEFHNSHPFAGTDISGRKWTLAHNGTIFESNVLNPYVHIQKGSTDSERILLHIINRINYDTERFGHTLNAEERFRIIDHIVIENSPKNKLNLLIYDGELMYVHCNCRYSLYMKNSDDGIIFSTKPLSPQGWTAAPFTRLSAFCDGKEVMSGTLHGIEYIPDQESIKALFLAYSGL